MVPSQISRHERKTRSASICLYATTALIPSEISGQGQAWTLCEDPTGKHRCTVCGKTYSRVQDLKTHKTSQNYHERKQPVLTHTRQSWTPFCKKKKIQNYLPKVGWRRYTENGELVHELTTENTWLFVYLGSIFETGGGHNRCTRTDRNGQDEIRAARTSMT